MIAVEDRAQSGVGLLVASAFFFSLMTLTVKAVSPSIPNQQIVLIRSLITLLLTGWALRRASISIWGSRKGWLLLRGLSGFLALTCLFYAIAHLSLAEATVLHFTYPLMAALLAALVVGESLTLRGMAGTLLGFAGVLLVARPPFLFALQPTAISTLTLTIALAGAFWTAIAYVCVRKLSSSEHPLVVIFYFPLVCVPAAALTAIPSWVWPSPLEWLLLLACGLATQLGQVYLTRGLFREPAARATAIGYLQLVFAALWGAIFFTEIPILVSAGGMVLIFAGTLLAARRRRAVALAGMGAVPPGSAD